ncbi:GNAT family N-acetyltransferase [Actinocatenispora sera]|nr:GNAT family N-acetyltransferase [Actinocatenispora sera]
MTTTMPAELVTRPLTAADAAAVTALMADCERVDLGEAVIEEADIVGDWQRPSFDLTADTLAVLDGDRLVGYAEVYQGRRAEVYVHPDHRGRGIGTALLGWTRRRAREVGSDLIGQTVPERAVDAVNLLRRNGYTPLWTSWVLELPAGAVIPAAPLPAGYAIRPYRPGEERAVYRTIEDAFAEWPDRSPTGYEDWAAGVLGRPGFRPAQLLVVVHGDEIVGACHLLDTDGDAWINQLAVRADQRGRGLARALLAEAFGAARTRGAQRAQLSTDSRTGALDLYRHVGMHVTITLIHLAARP